MNALRLTKGTPVVSVADGTEIGTIDHVYLDPERKEIVGFTVHRGGLLGGKTAGLVDVSDVHAFGPDAVTIDAAAAVRSEFAVEAHRDSLVELGSLLGRKVVSEDGVILGTVAAVRFGEGSHRLLALEVANGPAKPARRVSGAAVVTIGTDVIVVSAAAVVVSAGRPRREPERLFSVVGADAAGRRAG